MNEPDRYEQAVTIIRQAIENSRYRALQAGNAELLSLYYGIGKYISENVPTPASDFPFDLYRLLVSLYQSLLLRSP